ncbi:hypothetical protein AnigIFM56816_000220 [Aspergillus niger]|nr:hypothetical protein AnigIFM56816_000220 [Aspergillus niger]
MDSDWTRRKSDADQYGESLRMNSHQDVAILTGNNKDDPDWAAGGTKSDVYTYFWTHGPPNENGGAYHGSELYYAFHNLPYADTSSNWTETDYAIADIMQSYWVNLIENGNHNGDGLIY